MSTNPHVEGRGEGAALRPMSKAQIAILIRLARSAWEMTQNDLEVDADELEFPPREGAISFDAWRHQVCMETVERRGFRECRNEDFLPLKAHFLRLVGRDAEADAARLRAECEPRAWALHSLRQALSEAADVMPRVIEYVEGFLRNKRGCGIDDADTKALWHGVYVLRRKAMLERGKRTLTPTLSHGERETGSRRCA